jgi:hypothetical protein
MVIGLGFGLAMGGGLVYSAYTSESVRVILLVLGVSVVSVLLFGLPVLVINRQWTRAVFGDGKPPVINNRLNMPGFGQGIPQGPMVYPQQPAGYLPEGDSYAWPPVVQATFADVGDDEAIA